MLSLPHIWTPRKALWLPGMPLNPLGRFGVCGDPCCEDGDTSECGSCPDELPDEINLNADGFTAEYAYLNGDYVLSRVAGDPSGYCWWDYGVGEVCDDGSYVHNRIGAWLRSDAWVAGVTESAHLHVIYYAVGNRPSAGNPCRPISADIQYGRAGAAPCGGTSQTAYIYTLSE